MSALRTSRFSHDATASRIARRAMRIDLVDAGSRPRSQMDAEVVLGELVTNAVDHGKALVGGTIEVAWGAADGWWTIRVHDAGSWTGPVGSASGTATAGPRGRGRGLVLVRAMSARLLVQHRGGTSVTALLPLGERLGPRPTRALR